MLAFQLIFPKQRCLIPANSHGQIGWALSNLICLKMPLFIARGAVQGGGLGDL